MADASSNVSNAAGEWISVGTHCYCLHSNDTIIFRAQGDVTAEDIRSFGKVLLALPRPPGGFFYIANTALLRHQSAQTL